MRDALPFGFEVSSELDAPAAAVWAHATSLRGVNLELFPLFRMTGPAAGANTDLSAVPLGERLFRSWILLFGIVPVDYDDLTIVELEPGRRFLERSAMLTQRVWSHERTIELGGERGCTLTDRIAFAPRVPALGSLQQRIFRLVFAYRHRRLVGFFGGRTR